MCTFPISISPQFPNVQYLISSISIPPQSESGWVWAQKKKYPGLGVRESEPMAEGVVILLFGLFVRYSPAAEPGSPLPTAAAKDEVQSLYPFFMDVHVMSGAL